ncbi:MAG: dienelactone hydrolase family protein, partial [Planctomycetota bacterium]
AYWFGLTACQILCGAAVHQALCSRLVSSQGKKRAIGAAALLGASSLVVLGAVVGIAYSLPTPRPSYSFRVGQGTKSVTVDAFLPDGIDARNLPAVVIFHGVEGATPLMRLAIHYPNSKAISAKGVATYFVRYFDASPYDDLMIMKDDALDTDEIEKVRKDDYRQWIDLACQSITEVRNRPEVDPDRIAVVGYSLGCYVGTAATSRLCRDGYPCAIVGNFGSIWPEVEFDQSFPPIQFHHGEQDPVISVEKARQAKDRLLELGAKEVELFVYPEQGHVPSGPGSYDLRLKTEAFLRDKLDLP